MVQYDRLSPDDILWNDNKTLLTMIEFSAVQSSAQTFIHNPILLMDTPTMFDTTELID